MNETISTKPGYETTEFWLSLLATLLGFLLASGAMDAVPEESWIAKLIGGVVAVLATLGYSASRAKVKSETPSASSGQATNGGST